MRVGSILKFCMITFLSLVCINYGSDRDEMNACGGNSTLPGKPGESCHRDGTWECNGPDTLVCIDPYINACGGCTELANTWGGACNTCGTWACSDPNSLYCDEPVCLDCLDENFYISQVGVWRNRGDDTATASAGTTARKGAPAMNHTVTTQPGVHLAGAEEVAVHTVMGDAER